MDDLDFVTAPEEKTVYDPAVALDFFKLAGTTLKAPKGGTLFTEQTAGDKMYYVAAGEVALTAGGKNLDVLKTGEIIGEMSTILDLPRSATATARTDSILIGLAREQFFDTLRKKPEFALMMMRLLLARLRLVLSMLRLRGGLPGDVQAKSARMIDDTLLKSIAGSLGSTARSRFPKDRPIVVEGGSGSVMYIVLEGSAAISIKGKVVETVGVGGIFGEMALVDEGQRAATATAASDCALLAIDRASFINLVRSNPDFGVELLKNVCERLRYLNAQRR